MTTTLIAVPTILLCVIAALYTIHLLEERSRRRDREIVRRIHTYLSQIPPSRPW